MMTGMPKISGYNWDLSKTGRASRGAIRVCSPNPFSQNTLTAADTVFTVPHPKPGYFDRVMVFFLELR